MYVETTREISLLPGRSAPLQRTQAAMYLMREDLESLEEETRPEEDTSLIRHRAPVCLQSPAADPSSAIRRAADSE